MKIGEHALKVAIGVWALSKITTKFLPNILSRQQSKAEAQHPDSKQQAESQGLPFISQMPKIVKYLAQETRIKGTATVDIGPDGQAIIPKLTDYNDLTLGEKLHGFLYRHPKSHFALNVTLNSAFILFLRRMMTPNESIATAAENAFEDGTAITFSLVAFENFSMAYKRATSMYDYCQELKRVSNRPK